MTDVAGQRRLAASLLKCGVNRVWFDPERLSDIENAISREDLRGLITEGVIKAHQKKGVSRGRARARTAQRAYGHRKGAGKRKGAQGARTPSKQAWIQKIRAIRKALVDVLHTRSNQESVLVRPTYSGCVSLKRPLHTCRTEGRRIAFFHIIILSPPLSYMVSH